MFHDASFSSGCYLRSTKCTLSRLLEPRAPPSTELVPGDNVARQCAPSSRRLLENCPSLLITSSLYCLRIVHQNSPTGEAASRASTVLAGCFQLPLDFHGTILSSHPGFRRPTKTPRSWRGIKYWVVGPPELMRRHVANRFKRGGIATRARKTRQPR